LNDAGDFIAVFVQTPDNKNYKPQAVRGGMVVTAEAVIDCDPKAANTDATKKFTVKAGVAGWSVDSWDADWSNIASTIGTDWKKPVFTGLTGATWSKRGTGSCDTKIWESATACHAIAAPWGNGASTAPSATAGGSFDMYHWLADKKPNDATKLFQIEDGTVINYVVQTHIGKWVTKNPENFGNTAAITTSAGSYDMRCTAASDSWIAGTFTYSEGATGFIGMTAAALAAFATLF
jgi:hypothetical protein